MDVQLDLESGSPNFGDLLLVDGDLVLVDGKEAILQDVLQRMRSFLGEWFLNTDIGLPYFQQILVKNPDLSKIDALFINEILATPGVTELTSYSFSPDFSARRLTITFRATTTDGEIDYSGVL